MSFDTLYSEYIMLGNWSRSSEATSENLTRFGYLLLIIAIGFTGPKSSISQSWDFVNTMLVMNFLFFHSLQPGPALDCICPFHSLGNTPILNTLYFHVFPFPEQAVFSFLEYIIFSFFCDILLKNLEHFPTYRSEIFDQNL